MFSGKYRFPTARVTVSVPSVRDARHVDLRGAPLGWRFNARNAASLYRGTKSKPGLPRARSSTSSRYVTPYVRSLNQSARRDKLEFPPSILHQGRNARAFARIAPRCLLYWPLISAVRVAADLLHLFPTQNAIPARLQLAIISSSGSRVCTHRGLGIAFHWTG